jgi:hypothetical protein
MSYRRITRLDIVSLVTIHVFIFQVAVSAAFALITTNFASTFAIVLFFCGIAQMLSAVSAQRIDGGALNEWDGALWLFALSLAARGA